MHSKQKKDDDMDPEIPKKDITEKVNDHKKRSWKRKMPITRKRKWKRKIDGACFSYRADVRFLAFEGDNLYKFDSVSQGTNTLRLEERFHALKDELEVEKQKTEELEIKLQATATTEWRKKEVGKLNFDEAKDMYDSFKAVEKKLLLKIEKKNAILPHVDIDPTN
ncbi:hypothetical protein ACFE04_012604 [Oxalis oulophora]